MAHTGGIDERNRLEAIVYGRSATEAERAAATSALRSLVASAVAPVATVPPPVSNPAVGEEDAGVWSPLPAVPVTRVSGLAITGILAGLTLIAATVLSPPLPAFTDSMAIFERPPTAADATAAQEHPNLPGAGPDADLATVRLAAEPAEGVVVLVYRSTLGEVCLAIFIDNGGGGQCAAEADFRERGIEGGMLFPPTDWRFEWGPLGDPVITGPAD